MVKQSIIELLESEMDRKDFLKLVLFGMVAISGISQFITALSRNAPSSRITAAQSLSDSYGGSPYGGLK